MAFSLISTPDVPTQALIEHNLSVMAVPVCERPTLTFATRGQDCVWNRSSTDGSAALPERLSNHIGIRRSVHVQGDAVRYTHHGRWRSKAGQSVAYLLRNAGAGGSTWLTATSRLVSTRSLFQQVHPWWCVHPYETNQFSSVGKLKVQVRQCVRSRGLSF